MRIKNLAGKALESLFLTNITSPPLLFFFLGMLAVIVRSDLEVPAQAAKLLSLYLLLAIGFKGGVALSKSSLDIEVFRDLGMAVLLASIVPIFVFYLLKNKLSGADAAAIAASYGSISAVTFVTCASYLDLNNISWSGHLVAAMALMETPAIIVGILLYKLYKDKNDADMESSSIDWKELFQESCLNGSVFLIVGSLVIGVISGSSGMEKVSPFVEELFIGMLCLFLLDMGIVAARRLKDLKSSSAFKVSNNLSLILVVTAISLPLLNAALSGVVAWLLAMPEGNALLFVILGASASYIAVPAAMRLALPEANPSFYLTMSLAITFPFNLLIGIPLYHYILKMIL